MEGLERFVEAQHGVYPQALAEMRTGRKLSHWMWFVFPQVVGLGRSDMAVRYAIRDLDEARAYLAHPLLGPRLIESARAICRHAGLSASAILGGIDALKFRSSMTLFEAAASGQARALFGACLDAFYGGARDPETLRRIGSGYSGPPPACWGKGSATRSVVAEGPVESRMPIAEG